MGRTVYRRSGGFSGAGVALVAAAGLLAFSAVSAAAGTSEAEAAITRADARIEMATRQSGAAGGAGDQSFNMARSRVDSARAALKAGHADTAQMLADEASVLAELTSEKAKLAALQASHDLVSTSVATPAPVQP